MQDRLVAGYRTSAIEAALGILELGEELPADLLEQMLEVCVQRLGLAQFAVTLQLVAMTPSVRIAVDPFLRGLAMLMQRNAPASQIRLWLNLAVPKGQEPLEVYPPDYEDDERWTAAQDLEDALGSLTDEEGDEGDIRVERTMLTFTGCRGRPELNGQYQRSEDMTSHHRPVYEKILEKPPAFGKGSGKGGKAFGVFGGSKREEEDDDAEGKPGAVLLHYKRDNSKFGKSGWYFSRGSCGGEPLAWNARESRSCPPFEGWFVLHKSSKLPDPLHVDPSSGKGGPKRPLSASWETGQAERMLERIDLGALRGRLVTHDKSAGAAEYFGHFCVLMHLEHLEELRQLRRRARRIPEADLVKIGWALDGLPLVRTYGRREAKKNVLIGWEDPGSEMAAMALPWGFSPEKLRLKRGDSVTVSEAVLPTKGMGWKGAGAAAAAARMRFDDAAIMDFRPPNGMEPGQVTVRLRGTWPDGATAMRWRLDKGANITLYERQLQALHCLVSKPRSRVPELLITAKIGLVDAWAQKWRRGGGKGKGKGRGRGSKRKEKGRGKGPMIGAKPPKADELGSNEKLEQDLLQLLQEEEEERLTAAARASQLEEGDGAGDAAAAPKTEDGAEASEAATKEKEDEEERAEADDAAAKKEEEEEDAAAAAKAAFKLARRDPGDVKTDRMEDAYKEIEALTHLNLSQRSAVKAAMKQTCTVIQGPPGTGKTHVSVQVLRLWSKTLGLSPLLATSDSNVAVDNIAMGLKAEGAKPIRVGRPEKVNETLAEITLESILKAEKARIQAEVKEAKEEEQSTRRPRPKCFKLGKRRGEDKEQPGAVPKGKASGASGKEDQRAAPKQPSAQGMPSTAQEEQPGAVPKQSGVAAGAPGFKEPGVMPKQPQAPMLRPALMRPPNPANPEEQPNMPLAFRALLAKMQANMGGAAPGDAQEMEEIVNGPTAACGKGGWVGPIRPIRPPHLQDQPAVAAAKQPAFKKGSGPEEEAAKGKGKGKDKGKTEKQSAASARAEFELQMKLLQAADVICATTISAGGDFLSRFSFAGILIDEAAQATELAAVVPLILRGTQRLVLVGDHCQLPPTVQSTEAEARGLSVSLYSRMINGGGIPSFLLDTQYRSHPLLAEFSARAFYGGRLKTGINAEERPPPEGVPWSLEGVPVAFIEASSEESMDGDSKMNPGEAQVVMGVIRGVLMKQQLGLSDMGVVTPYVAQVRHLRRIVKAQLPGVRTEDLEIASVDNFQGREKELIIFSAVRSNWSGTVGFLADWRRLNVMLTRARRGLVVCGSADTLKTDPHWSRWLDFCSKVGKGQEMSPLPEFDDEPDGELWSGSSASSSGGYGRRRRRDGSGSCRRHRRNYRRRRRGRHRDDSRQRSDDSRSRSRRSRPRRSRPRRSRGGGARRGSPSVKRPWKSERPPGKTENPERPGEPEEPEKPAEGETAGGGEGGDAERPRSASSSAERAAAAAALCSPDSSDSDSPAKTTRASAAPPRVEKGPKVVEEVGRKRSTVSLAGMGGAGSAKAAANRKAKFSFSLDGDGDDGSGSGSE